MVALCRAADVCSGSGRSRGSTSSPNAAGGSSSTPTRASRSSRCRRACAHSLAYASPIDFHEHYTYGTRIGQAGLPDPDARPRLAAAAAAGGARPAAGAVHARGRVLHHRDGWAPRKPIVYDGVEYGTEGRGVLAHRRRCRHAWRSCLEIALGGTAPYDAIRAAGWRIADAAAVTATPWTYRDYIAQSRGEFSVAVNLEVKARSGWFSDRTAAYLACGQAGGRAGHRLLRGPAVRGGPVRVPHARRRRRGAGGDRARLPAPLPGRAPDRRGASRRAPGADPRPRSRSPDRGILALALGIPFPPVGRRPCSSRP